MKSAKAIQRFLIPVCIGMVVLAMVFSGCASVPKPQPRNGKIVLEFWTLQMLTFSDYINAMIDDYEGTHPNIEIKWIDVPFNEGAKKALTSMLSNQVPDVINLNPDFSAILASRGALTDMNQLVTPQQRTEFLPTAWEASTLNGMTFGIPWYLTSAVTLYNDGLFQQAGAKAPPQNYIELAQAARAFRQHNAGYILMPALAQDGRFFRFLRKSGIPIWDEQEKLAFADHGADKELAYWVGLYKAGLIPQDVVTEGNEGAVDRFQSGTLGMLLTGPNYLKIVKENAPKVFQHTGVAPQFPAQSAYTDFSVMLLVVPQRSAHPKEAVDFALFVTNRANTLKLAQLAPVLPPLKSALEDPQFNQVHSTDLMTRARSISARQLLTARETMTIHPLQNRLNQIMDYYVQSALLGKMDPHTAMQKAQADMNQLIQ